MEKQLQDIFLYLLQHHCKIVLYADTQVRPSGYDYGRIWSNLQCILTSSANISKVLFPSKPKPGKESNESKEYCERGQHLCNLLDVSSDSPLHSRKLRNLFEHFDENLHIWAERSKSKSYAGFNIGSTRIGDPNAEMGNFDPEEFVVKFWGENVQNLTR